MPDTVDIRAVGDRIEMLLDQLAATSDRRAYDQAAELLRLITELYGAGLARILTLAAEESPVLVERLAADDLVASLLLVHGLHPESLERRVEAALAGVRPLLAAHGGDVELMGIEPERGAVRLRLLGSCDGCPSSSATLEMAVERAIRAAAPEILAIDVEAPTPAAPAPVSVSLTAKPRYDECPAEMAEA